MQAGSILSIKCTIFHDRGKSPKYVWWYQGARRLAYNSSRGGISLQVRPSYSLFINQPHIKSIEGSKDLDQ